MNINYNKRVDNMAHITASCPFKYKDKYANFLIDNKDNKLPHGFYSRYKDVIRKLVLDDSIDKTTFAVMEYMPLVSYSDLYKDVEELIKAHKEALVI